MDLNSPEVRTPLYYPITRRDKSLNGKGKTGVRTSLPRLVPIPAHATDVATNVAWVQRSSRRCDDRVTGGVG